MMSLHFITDAESVRAIAAPQHRSGGASPLSRQAASQPKALLTIAGALRDWRGLLVVGLLVGLAVVL